MLPTSVPAPRFIRLGKVAVRLFPLSLSPELRAGCEGSQPLPAAQEVADQARNALASWVDESCYVCWAFRREWDGEEESFTVTEFYSEMIAPLSKRCKGFVKLVTTEAQRGMRARKRRYSCTSLSWPC